MFIVNKQKVHFKNERLFYHKKINNTMNQFIALPTIFLWLDCYSVINFRLKNTCKNLTIVILSIHDKGVNG